MADANNKKIIVFRNGDMSYLARKWTNLYAKWVMSNSWFGFLSSFETILPGDEFEKMTFVERGPGQPMIDNIIINESSGGNWMVVYHPFSTGSYFWKPDLVEFHNYKGVIMWFQLLMLSGWTLDESESTVTDPVEAILEDKWNSAGPPKFLPTEPVLSPEPALSHGMISSIVSIGRC